MLLLTLPIWQVFYKLRILLQYSSRINSFPAGNRFYYLYHCHWFHYVIFRNKQVPSLLSQHMDRTASSKLSKQKKKIDQFNRPSLLGKNILYKKNKTNIIISRTIIVILLGNYKREFMILLVCMCKLTWGDTALGRCPDESTGCSTGSSVYACKWSCDHVLSEPEVTARHTPSLNQEGGLDTFIMWREWT